MTNKRERPKRYGRAAYDASEAATNDTRLAHTEVVATLEWIERGRLDIAMDRLHLAYRFIGETLQREGRIPKEDPEDECTD